jgi:HNH endonuclease
MKRLEFPHKVRRLALSAAGGVCACGCGQKLEGRRIEFHHYKAAVDGGLPTLENCRPYLQTCHLRETTALAGSRAKSTAAKDRQTGVVRPKSALAVDERKSKHRTHLAHLERRSLFRNIT